MLYLIQDSPNPMIGSILFYIVIALYFIPSIVALIRSKSNLLAIIALNILLGWTVIGWIVALVWSLTSNSKAQQIVINNKSDEPHNDNLSKLEKLKKLLDSDAITREEFEVQKKKLLDLN